MPKKATYLEFEENPELEFEHYLTLKLGLGTVDRMRKVMSQSEYAQWVMYFRRDAQRKELASMKAGL